MLQCVFVSWPCYCYSVFIKNKDNKLKSRVLVYWSGVMNIVLFSLFLLARSSFSCSDTVTFSSPDFTIKGPCPDSTVIAPVGSTVHYRCDYEDRKSGVDLPYWHIAGLGATPFLLGEGNEHSVTIVSVITATGNTIITIPILEQYLNNTLNIRCGLCSAPVCYDSTKPTINILSENITSNSTVELVTFGECMLFYYYYYYYYYYYIHLTNRPVTL